MVAGAQAIDIPEGTSKLELANQIDRNYVVPLGLKGKPAAQAIEVLLSEGFRCRLQQSSQVVPSEPPLSRCVKSPSQFGPLCNELIVTLRFERSTDIQSQSDLLDHLDIVKVASALPFCPYQRQASPSYLAGRGAGEKELAQQASTLNLLGNARVTFDKLLLEGYYCGFELVSDPEKAVNRTNLVCTLIPTKSKLCFEAKLVLEITWQAPLDASKRWREALKSADIKGIRSSCELPPGVSSKDQV